MNESLDYPIKTAPYVDMKQTMWIRYYFKPGSDLNKIKEALIKDHNDVADEELGYDYSEDLMDTTEDMLVEDNEGFSTIEIHDENHQIFWENSSE